MWVVEQLQHEAPLLCPQVGLSTSQWGRLPGPLGGRFQAGQLHQRLGVRNCFHPGASALSRDYVGVPAKDVTGREMLGALAAYVWPKVSYGMWDCVYKLW